MVRPDDHVALRPVERVQREAGVADLVEILAERIPPTDLQSLLLEVYRRRAARVSAADLLTRYAENRFTRPSAVDPVALAALELRAWAGLPEGYQAIELSPLCPLGTNSAIATVDQNKVVTTIRNTEVVSDSTNVLALEAAERRRRLRQHSGHPVGTRAAGRLAAPGPGPNVRGAGVLGPFPLDRLWSRPVATRGASPSRPGKC